MSKLVLLSTCVAVLLACVLHVSAEFEFSDKADEDRISQFVDFFNFMKDNADKSLKDDVQSERLETVPAMHLLRNQIKEKAYKFKCNKYYKLIRSPFITMSTVQSLAEEHTLSNEVLNFESNLLEGLDSEISFNALNRLAVIIKSLTKETKFGKSLYDLDMQNELQNCVSYFIYRHQNALHSAVKFVQDYNQSLRPLLQNPKTNDELAMQVQSAFEKVRAVENKANLAQVGNEALVDFYDEWWAAIKELCTSVIESKFHVDPEVREFIAQRQEELDKQEPTKEKLKELISTVEKYERDNKISETTEIDDNDYIELLTKIESIGQMPPGRFRKPVNEFMSQYNRAARANKSDAVEDYKIEIRRMMEEEEAQKKAAADKLREEEVQLAAKRKHRFSLLKRSGVKNSRPSGQ